MAVPKVPPWKEDHGDAPAAEWARIVEDSRGVPHLNRLASGVRAVSQHLWDGDLESAAAALHDLAPGLQAAAACKDSKGDLSAWTERILKCANAQWSFAHAPKSKGFKALAAATSANQKEVLRRDPVMRLIRDAASGNVDAVTALAQDFWFSQEAWGKAMCSSIAKARSKECYELVGRWYRLQDLSKNGKTPAPTSERPPLFIFAEQQKYDEEALAVLAEIVKDWPEMLRSSPENYPPLAIYAAKSRAPTSVVYAFLPSPKIPRKWLYDTFPFGERGMSAEDFVRFLTDMPELQGFGGTGMLDPRVPAIVEAAQHHQERPSPVPAAAAAALQGGPQHAPWVAPLYVAWDTARFLFNTITGGGTEAEKTARAAEQAAWVAEQAARWAAALAAEAEAAEAAVETTQPYDKKEAKAHAKKTAKEAKAAAFEATRKELDAKRAAKQAEEASKALSPEEQAAFERNKAARTFPALLKALGDIVAEGATHTALSEFSRMLNLVKEPETAPLVRAAMQLYGGLNSEADLGRAVAHTLLTRAPDAATFLDIAYGCKEVGLQLEYGKECTNGPVETMWGLLDALLEARNYRLLESLLRYGTSVDDEGHKPCYILLRCTTTSPFFALLNHEGLPMDVVRVAVKAAEAAGVDVDQGPPSALNLALQDNSMDFALELLQVSRQLTPESGDGDGGGATTLLASQMAGKKDANSERLARGLLDQAVRLLGVGSAALAAHVNTPAADGSTPLYCAVQAFHALVDPLINSGADILAPFYLSGRKNASTTVLHLVVDTAGDAVMLRRLLDVAVHAGYLDAIATLRDGMHGRTLMQAAFEAPAAAPAKVAALLAAGVSLLPFTADSLLISALQAEEAGKQGAAEIVRALLTGWTPAHVLSVLGPATAAHHSLLLKFLRKYEAGALIAVSQTRDHQLACLQGAVDAAATSPLLLDFILERLAPRAQLSLHLLNLHDAMGTLSGPQVEALAAVNGVPINAARAGVRLTYKAVEAANIPALEALLKPPEARNAVMEALVRKKPSLLLSTNTAGQTPRQYTKYARIQRILKQWEEQGPPGREGGAGWALEEDEGDEAVDIKAFAATLGVAHPDFIALGPLDDLPESRKRERVEAMLGKLGAALDEEDARRAPPAHAEALAPAGGGAAAFGTVALAAAHAVLPDSSVAPDEVYSDDEGEEEIAAQGAAAVAKAAAAEAAGVDLGAALTGMPWELTVTREAYTEWSSMDPSFRRMVLLKLREIAQGRWETMGACKRRQGEGIPAGMRLWRCKFTKSGRIVFDVAPDWSVGRGLYTDLIRIWCITLDHKRYENEITKVVASVSKAQRVTAALRLRPMAPGGDATPTEGELPSGKRERLPRFYVSDGGAAGEGGEAAAPSTTTAIAADVIEQYPAANVGQGTYTLLKFYDLSAELARSILAGGAEAVEFPFRVSPDETRIIGLQPKSAVILAGRSGTGKTTCAVFRLFSQWMTAWRTEETHAAVFVTASGTLRREVARSFAKMRRAVLPADVAEELEALAARPVVTLRDVPEGAFPLFLSQKNFLEALDATLEVPFFPRREDGTILWEQGGEGAIDSDGMAQEIDLAPESDDEDSDEEELTDDDVFGDERENAAAGGARGDGAGPHRWHRHEMSYAEFAAKWGVFTPSDLRGKSGPGKSGAARVPTALVWADIVSYIKGSAEAVRSESGHLSLQEYLEVGRKRAPNFDADVRADVYRVYEGYERYKRNHARYDAADVVAHLSRRLTAEGGYTGTPLHALYRDEVQDFMQGELLLDLRIMTDPNAIFYSGDTAQTIARGVGFRFTDIKTLFHEEGAAALAAQHEAAERRRGARAGGAAAARQDAPAGPPLAMPVIELLKVNYRTHSGILDAASAAVDVLKRYFPAHIDPLQRERAFFSGPLVLLIAGAPPEDLARLLSWSDRADSQVEFGAHQVVLVRSEADKAALPRELRGARPLTVAQAKGLEFDDVLLYNFFGGSAAKKREWSVLLNYLAELEAAAAESDDAAPLPLTPEQAAEGVGRFGFDALRALESVDPNAIRVLCDELKHLYTALTRGKNFVAIVDDAAEARAPFYYFLARLGLGRVITDVGTVEKRDLGLSKSESTPTDWAQRGASLMELKMFEYAALDFEKAGDTAMAQYCRAGALMAAAAEQATEAPAAAQSLYHTASVMLIDLAVRGTRPPAMMEALRSKGHPDIGRRTWAAQAARALARAGEPTAAAAVTAHLGRFKQARRKMFDAGDVAGAAQVCAAAAATLRARGESTEAQTWTLEAFRLYKAAGDYSGCMKMLESAEGVAEALRRNTKAAAGSVDPVDAVYHHMMVATFRSGTSKDPAPILAASRHIQDPAMRMRLLQRAGLWGEVAAAMPDAVAAAEVLEKHVGYVEAARRVLEGLKKEGRERSITLKEAELLCRCALAAGDMDLLVEVDAVVAQSEAFCRGHSVAAARLTAGILLRLAAALASPDAKGVSKIIPNGLVGRFTAFFNIWKGGAKVGKGAPTDAALWPDKATLEDLEALERRIQGIELVSWLETGARGNPRTLVLAALGLSCGAARGGECALGIMRCVALLRKIAPEDETLQNLPAAVLTALQAANSSIQWLSQHRGVAAGVPAGVHRDSPSPAAAALIKEIAEFYALSGLGSELRGTAERGGGDSGGDEVSWPQHDRRFSKVMDLMRNEKDSDGQSGALDEGEERAALRNAVPAGEAALALLWALNGLMKQAKLLMGGPSAYSATPTMEAATAEEMSAALALALRAVLLSDTLVEALEAARRALPWVPEALLEQLKHQRGALWDAFLRAASHAYPDGSCKVCSSALNTPMGDYDAFMTRHRANVKDFYAHSSWCQAEVVPWVGESRRLEAALRFLAQQQSGFEKDARRLRRILFNARKELLDVLETVEGRRDWGWHLEPAAAALVATLSDACREAFAALQQAKSNVDGAAGGVARSEAAAEGAAAAREGTAVVASSLAALSPQSLVGLTDDDDDQFVDPHEEEDVWEEAARRKERRGGKKGGRW